MQNITTPRKEKVSITIITDFTSTCSVCTSQAMRTAHLGHFAADLAKTRFYGACSLASFMFLFELHEIVEK